ncbi:MAG: UDP binding domain-containing protein [Syntrophales bacterium]|nr:UDP binding domain-containing protein [Syntrophales bacterium]
MKGARVLILGLAYKRDVDDPRESPSFRLIELLEEKGAIVDYNDPYIPKAPKMRRHKIEKESIYLTKENLSKYDCVLIATDHSSYDPDFIVRHSKLIIDTRNLIKERDNSKVQRA